MSRPLRTAWEKRSQRNLQPITTVEEYEGQAAVALSVTQLGLEYTRAQASKIVAEWMEFFAAGPSPITELDFVTRTPKRLFEALAGQTQLRCLYVKWGDYEDLCALSGLTMLQALRLGGASSVRTIAPLAGLSALTHLEIESLKYARDLSPLGHLTGLVQLELGGNWMSPRIAHIDSLSWLPSLQQLTDLLLHTMIVDDLDYSPVLQLPRLEAVRIMRARGMRPSGEELEALLPWSA